MAAPPDTKPATAATIGTKGGGRASHQVSEQRRRQIVRTGFADLVRLVQQGEAVSGILISAGATKSRGRGRKSEIAGADGASKSTVLKQALRYLKWVETGNEALRQEIAQLEAKVGGTSLA